MNTGQKKLSEKLRHLLIMLERIIGNSVYNGNIQNYGPGGYAEAEGRWIRYPLRFPGSSERHYRVPETITDEQLLKAYYPFGANQLAVMSALNEILTFLEQHCDFAIETIGDEALPRETDSAAKLVLTPVALARRQALEAAQRRVDAADGHSTISDQE